MTNPITVHLTSEEKALLDRLCESHNSSSKSAVIKQALRELAQKENEKAVATAWEAYDKATAPAWEAYEKARAPAWEAYKKVVATAWEAYEKAVAPAWEAYEKAVASARAVEQ